MRTEDEPLGSNKQADAMGVAGRAVGIPMVQQEVTATWSHRWALLVGLPCGCLPRDLTHRLASSGLTSRLGVPKRSWSFLLLAMAGAPVALAAARAQAARRTGRGIKAGAHRPPRQNQHRNSVARRPPLPLRLLRPLPRLSSSHLCRRRCR
jgi:hypothetical protein